jgi:hypothetical protein
MPKKPKEESRPYFFTLIPEPLMFVIMATSPEEAEKKAESMLQNGELKIPWKKKMIEVYEAK